MTKWILIMMVISGSNTAMTSAEFEDREACLSARTGFIQLVAISGIWQQAFPLCVPKASVKS